MASQTTTLTDRQQRELEYHRSHAVRLRAEIKAGVNLDVVRDPRRRWWNAYWCAYTKLRNLDLTGKSVLVPGCGIGDDALRIASLGAAVRGFDLSPDLLEIATERAASTPGVDVKFDIMPAESLAYPDRHFDLVFFIDILHHVDIPAAMREVARVMKPGGLVIGDELYTHSLSQRVRDSAVVSKVLYPRMQNYVYREDPYITEDERKINERELGIVRAAFPDDWNVSHFGMLEGRLFPATSSNVPAQLDRLTLKLLRPVSHYLAGRVVFAGKRPARN